MDYFAINKKLWDDKTEIHFRSEFYDVNSFINGKNSLKEIELGLLGDITGKTILHLQCHFGMDTISLARKGAKVTGVDFSGKAIEKARELNKIAGTDVEFIESNIYELEEKLEKQFDIVFTSYGVLGWLPDIGRWSVIVDKFLKPSGRFIMVEFHPVLWIFSDDFKEIIYDYADSGPIIEEFTGTYADRNAPLKSKSVGWNHNLSEVLGSLLKRGFIIRDFAEYDFSPFDCFNNTVETGKDKYRIKGLEKKIPMLYSVAAEKRGKNPADAS